MRVVYRAAALDEIRDAFAWDLKEAGQLQAQRFRDEFNAKLALLVAHPPGGTAGAPGAPGTNDIRQMPLKVFPYTVYFKVQGDVIRVFAVAHHKRRPGYWLKR